MSGTRISTGLIVIPSVTLFRNWRTPFAVRWAKSMDNRMEPYIQALWTSVSHLDPIEEWVPESNHTVQYWLNIDVGLRGEIGREDFSVLILTEDSQRHFSLKRTPPKRCLVIPGDYEWAKVRDDVQRVFESCLTSDFSDLCERLAKHFKWDDWGVSRGKRRRTEGHNNSQPPAT